MPTDPLLLASKLKRESLHRQIQIDSHAARLLEHKLQWEALLSLSNTLSIIHKTEKKKKKKMTLAAIEKKCT